MPTQEELRNSASLDSVINIKSNLTSIAIVPGGAWNRIIKGIVIGTDLTLFSGAKYPSAVLIGWQVGETIPKEVQDIRNLIAPKIKHKNFGNYAFGAWWFRDDVFTVDSVSGGTIHIDAIPVKSTIVRALTLADHFDGSICCKCNEPVHMSEPNQENGTFICRSCRQNPYRNYRAVG